LGSASEFLAKPVLRGYAFGLAIVIITRQIPSFLGVNLKHIEQPTWAAHQGPLTGRSRRLNVHLRAGEWLNPPPHRPDADLGSIADRSEYPKGISRPLSPSETARERPPLAQHELIFNVIRLARHTRGSHRHETGVEIPASVDAIAINRFETLNGSIEGHTKVTLFTNEKVFTILIAAMKGIRLHGLPDRRSCRLPLVACAVVHEQQAKNALCRLTFDRYRTDLPKLM
jgi:hypothetical protein